MLAIILNKCYIDRMIETQPRPIKAIGEDWDDFKVISQQVVIEQTIAAAALRGRLITPREVKEHYGKGIRVELGYWFGHETPHDVSDRDHANHLETIDKVKHLFPKRLQPKAHESHRRLLAAGLPMFIVTNHNTTMAEREIAELGFNPDDYLFIHGSDITRSPKPSPAAFDGAVQILGQMGIRPSEVIYGGDTISDGIASTGAGMQFLGVTSGRHSQGDFHREGFRAVKTHSDFSKYVLRNAVREP